MKSKTLYRIFADILFVFHAVLFVLILAGFLFPALWYPYMAVLVLALASDILFGYCLLSKWEFELRRKWNPNIDYNYTFASFYTYRLTNNKMSDVFYRRAALVFLAFSIGLNLYFKV
ncbi:MAG: DUF2784 family protein [Candidatus Pacebacteria bacterium]|nr:DUF2784 family protein [Candidatus Paceibacterota bacterium]